MICTARGDGSHTALAVTISTCRSRAAISVTTRMSWTLSVNRGSSRLVVTFSLRCSFVALFGSFFFCFVKTPSPREGRRGRCSEASRRHLAGLTAPHSVRAGIAVHRVLRDSEFGNNQLSPILRLETTLSHFIDLLTQHGVRSGIFCPTLIFFFLVRWCCSVNLRHDQRRRSCDSP